MIFMNTTIPVVLIILVIVLILAVIAVIWAKKQPRATDYRLPIMNKIMFAVGLIIAITAASLMVLTKIPSGYLTVLGIIGIGLIATSGIQKKKKQ